MEHPTKSHNPLSIRMLSSTASNLPTLTRGLSFQYIDIMLIMYGPLVTAIKLSVLLQYLNIFATTRRMMCVGCHMVIWSHVVLYTVYMFLRVFICSPREKFWHPLTPGHCFTADVSSIAAAFNALADFVILLLPQRTIWKLQMPRRRKIGISAIFLSGLL